jgi:hypothetical protein
VGGAREFEMGSRAWVLAIALGLVAVHTVSATNYTLGGTDGWTYKANINYTNELATVTLKVGDTLSKSMHEDVKNLPQANLHQSSSSIPNDWAFRG